MEVIKMVSRTAAQGQGDRMVGRRGYETLATEDGERATGLLLRVMAR